MQFEQKTITILDSDHQPVEVQSWQGVGTGLAYHHPIYKDQPQGKDFILVHVPTGLALTKLTLPTEPEAQTFLVAVAALDPDQWNLSEAQYLERYYDTGLVHELRARVELAHYNALLSRDELFIYALDADGDVVDGADRDVESDDPENEQTKKLVDACFKSHTQVTHVCLTCMDSKTGEHKLLHTYERPAAVEAQRDKSKMSYEDLKDVADHLASIKSDEAFFRYMSEG